jgi:CRP-like cAMP-binding protein
METNVLDELLCGAVTLKQRCFASGEFVFHKEDTADNIFTIEKGQVKLTRYTMEGRSVVLCRSRIILGSLSL